MEIKISERPFKEICISDIPEMKESYDWVYSKSKFHHIENSEFIILLPHPKHKTLGGLTIEEFLMDCPEELSILIHDIYDERVKERESGNWNSGLDLDNDFGFVLIAFL